MFTSRFVCYQHRERVRELLFFQLEFSMMHLWLRMYLLMAIASIRNATETQGFVFSNSSDRPNQNANFTTAIVTSENLTEIQTVVAEALVDIGKTYNGTQLNAKVFYLEKANASLENLLVKFCEEVFRENVTSVIMTDETSQKQLNLVAWILSYLGIPVLVMRSSRGFSTEERQHYSTVLGMKPAPYQQTSMVSRILLLYQWTRVAVISSHSHASGLSETLQKSDKYLIISTTVITETTDPAELSLQLDAVKRSDASVIILDCPATLTKHVIHSARNLGLVNGNHAWIVSEWVMEDTSGTSRLPAGLLGIRLRRSCDSRMNTLFRDLLHDSLMVLTHAQTSFTDAKGKIFSSKQSSCYGDIGRTDRNIGFFRHILNTKLTGNTGSIQFDSFGNRINPEYEVMNLQTKTNGNKEWIKIGHWSHNELIFNKIPIEWPGNRFEPPTKVDLTKVVRVVTAITEPFAFFSSLKEWDTAGGTFVCAIGRACKVYKLTPNGSYTIEQNCCCGFAIDLLGMLENDLGFKADLRVVKDGKYGSIDKSGKWNGLIGELVRGEADLAIADLTITDSRSRAVDFTQPFLHSGMNILVVVQKDVLNSWLPRFMEPFSTGLWLAGILTINTIFILLWFVDRISPCGHYKKGRDYKQRKRFHLIASLWFSWGTVFHTDECETRPRSYSARLITVVFAFAMLVLTNAYTANLAAVLVSGGNVLPISGIEDPKLQNPPKGFKVATVADTSLEKLFKGSKDAVYSQIWRNIKANSVNTFAEGVQKVINGELTGFIGDEPTLLYHISKQESCNLKLAGKSFFQSGFGLALPKNSSLTRKLSTILIQYEQHDVSQNLAKNWLWSSCVMKGASFKRMGIDDVKGAYVIMFVGVVVSFLVLAFEFYVDKFGFPLSYIWTNKPDRSWPSTRELYKKGLPRSKLEALSLAPLELGLRQWNFTPTLRDAPNKKKLTPLDLSMSQRRLSQSLRDLNTMQNSQSEASSLAPVELQLGRRRLSQRLRDGKRVRDSQSEAFSSASVELGLSPRLNQRRLTQSLRDPWNCPQNKTNTRSKLPDCESVASPNAFSVYRTNSGDNCDEKMKKRNSGRTSIEIYL